MNSRKKLLEKSRLYAIIDKETAGTIPVHCIARGIIQSKAVQIAQFRNKAGSDAIILKEILALKKNFRGTNTLLIANDSVLIAKIADLDGVHLGQDDLPATIARKILGKNKLIGVSCHSLKDALRAQKDGADYIGLGPVFATPTKPEYKAVGTALIASVMKRMHIPVFVIGGINEETLPEVLAGKARRIAVCRPACVKNNVARLKRLDFLLLKYYDTA